MTTTQLDAPLTTAPAARLLPRLARDTRYVLTGFPLALVAFTVAVTGFTTGLGLAVVWIGVPLVAATMMFARGFAAAERERIAPVLGGPARTGRYRTTGTGAARRVLTVLADPQSWRDLAHAILRFVPSTISFSFVTTWWAGMLGGFSWSLWGWSLPSGPDGDDLPEILGLGDGYLTATVFYLMAGLLFAVTLPLVARAAAQLEARFANALLNR